MRGLVFLATCLVIAGCGIAAQPESIKTVAAYEVPLPSEADRDQFLSVLRAVAEAEGMHVDAESAQNLAQEAKVSPAFSKTINAAVWRGANDDEAVASAMDQPDHLGQVWIMFSKGKDPVLTTRFRESAMRAIMRQWPDTLSLPVMPTGAIPLPRDLIRTPGGYIVNSAEAHRYELEGVKSSGPHLSKSYDSSSLVEILRVADLPEGLRQQASSWLISSGKGPNGRCCQFLVGGASGTSALIAYEEYGYVPSTYATAYVHTESGWSAIREWSDVDHPKTLQDLKNTIDRFATP